MNTNDLLAAPTRTHGFGGAGILIILVVLAALGYGAVRVTRRVRLSRPAAPGRRPRSRTAPSQPSPALGQPPPSLSQPSPKPHGAPPRLRAAGCQRSPTGGWAVETHGLTKRFGATVAVDDVELLVPRGSAFGYLGPNGAGKTTLIRTLLGLTKANGGTMSLLGTPVPAERSKALARVGGHRRRAPLPPPPDRPGKPPPAGCGPGRRREPADRAVAGPGRPDRAAPQTRSPRTRWACASAWAWPRACSATPSCSSSTSP